MNKDTLGFIILAILLFVVTIGLLILAWMISPAIFLLSVVMFFVGLFAGK